MTQTFALEGNRCLVVGTLDATPSNLINPPFVSLMPAFNSSDRRQAAAIANSLIDLGCVEFCCVGPEGEQLHDTLDEIIEGRGALEIVTMWDADPDLVCEYFLYAAAAGKANLLALLSGHHELQAILEMKAQDGS